MLKIKKYIRKLLIYLLKKLNMPKAFEEFTAHDMEQIRKQIEIVIDLTKLVGNIRSVRIDNNSEVFVLEYKKQTKIALDLYDYNNPDLSVNIKNNLSCILVGFGDKDEILINRIVNNYSKANDFIR